MIILSMVFTLNANAGLITTGSDQTSYNNGDIVTFDVWVNALNPDLDNLFFDLSFDDTQLSFIDNSWFDSDEVFDFFAFGDAFLLAPTTVAVETFFLNGITDVVGTSFKLGELQFTALGNLTNPRLDFALLVDAQNIYGETIEPQVLPEPSTLALFSLMSLLFFTRRSNNH